MKRLYSIAAVLVLSAACREPFQFVPPGSGNWLSEQLVGAGSSDITVMTQNLYVGADVDLVIRALGTPDPGDDSPRCCSRSRRSAKPIFRRVPRRSRIGSRASGHM